VPGRAVTRRVPSPTLAHSTFVARYGLRKVARRAEFLKLASGDVQRLAAASPRKGSAMSRRLSAFAVASALLAAQFGCHSCGNQTGWFSARSRCEAPCQTVGLSGGCFDGATGQPCPCSPEAPGVLPGGAYPGGGYPVPIPGAGPPPDQLHMPNPSDLIRPPAVPIPAPGDASLPFPSYPGTPVKMGSNK
jgi:hypothetical protein